MPEVKYNVLQKPLEERLRDAACIYWNVPEEFFKEKNIKDSLKRRLLFYLLHHDAEMNIRAIAEQYGFNHDSIYDGINNIDFQKNIYPTINRKLNDIRTIAANLDAEFVTVDIKLQTRPQEKQ